MKILIYISLLFVSCSAAAQVTVFSDDFSTGISNQWTLLNLDANTCVSGSTQYNSGWISVGDSMIGSCSNFTPVGTANRWIISPALILGAYNNILTWRARSFDPSFPDAYDVLISSTGTSTTDFNDTLFSQGGETPEWDSLLVNLSLQNYNSQTVYIAIKHRSIDKNILFIDDFKVVKNAAIAALNGSETSIIELYPNPSSHVVEIKSASKIDHIQMFSSNGKEMKVDRTVNNINISDFNAGLYFLHITINGKVEIKKLVKI
jgi:hypothetical protein